MLQQDMPQQQGLIPAIPLPPQAPIQGVNQFETPACDSHTQSLQGALVGHSEQVRLDMKNPTVWGSGEAEIAGGGMDGERKVGGDGGFSGLEEMICLTSGYGGARGSGMEGEGKGRGDGGVGGLEEMICLTSGYGGAHGSGMEHRENHFPGGVGAAGVAAAGSGMAGATVRVETTGTESTGARLMEVRGGVAVAGVAAAARGGEGDLLTSVDGLEELTDVEALLLTGEGEVSFLSSMFSWISQHPSSSMIGAIQPVGTFHTTGTGMVISQLPEGLAPTIPLGSTPYPPMHTGDEGSFALEERVAAAMAAFPTANTSGGSDGMWSKGQGALLLPGSYFKAPGSGAVGALSWLSLRNGSFLE
ncbi:unnamed protein product [Closterium sp. Naga37s-1]|nr:unnamed protein product [Closterium sp. Naga37s-1]